MKKLMLVMIAACLPLAASQAAPSAGAPSANDWVSYGHDAGGGRFSPLTQIAPDNVSQLQIAWTYHMNPVHDAVADSKKVVEICTLYAQKGMLNIFLVVFFSTLAFAFFDPYFFIGYLISIAIIGLYQAIFMANAGGAWDNAKKVVEEIVKALE